MKNCRWICHINVASGIRQYLHFIVHPAGESIRTICQGEVAMNERVFRLRIPVLIRKPTVIVRQSVTKTDQLLFSLRGARWLGQSMMKMNVNLSPARVAEL